MTRPDIVRAEEIWPVRSKGFGMGQAISVDGSVYGPCTYDKV